MTAKPQDAFLSYTRFDDRLGAISRFRKWLSETVREVSGEPFEIFQDIDDIGVSERWSDKLEQILEWARFFIPIMTPSYFKSEECRAELERFLDTEKKAGREDLIIPIYYIESPALEDRALREADPLAKVLSSRQHYDWRELRHSSFRNRKVRLKIDELARQIDRARQRAVLGSAAAAPPRDPAGVHKPTPQPSAASQQTMIFSVEVRRARTGNCLLLHFGSKDDPGLVMVDGGPRGVYAPHLKPRLEQIRAARGLAEEEALGIDLLMVSHVNDDHIRGILDLTKELLEDKAQQRPPPVRVLDFWCNSFDDLIGGTPDELTAAFKSQFGAAAITGALPDDATIDADDEDLDEETIVASLRVLANIQQGSRLRGDAKALGVPLNSEFAGKPIVARQAGEALEIAPGLSFIVAGPMIAELEDLHQKHEDWLKDLKEKGKSPPQALAAYVDKSVPNLSSIVVLAEAGDKRMLLTGDARGDKILEGLELVGALPAGGTMHVDLLKVPHHGSANNLDHDFFERITADHYVFSGDGEQGNPEREALQMLLDARGDADYTIHLTYPVEEIDAARQDDWIKGQTIEKKKQQKIPNRKVRPDWSPQKHSLAAFLTDHSELGEKVRVVEAHKAHVIDLGEPLGRAWPSLVT